MWIAGGWSRIVLVALGLLAAADSSALAKPPNFLVIIADDQRPDTIAALGNAPIRTPNLDSLVRRGVAFTRAVCANPICHASRAEILTGRCSIGAGAAEFNGRLNRDRPLWPECLRDAGYHTWFVGKWHNDGRPTERGFERTNGLFAGGGGKFELPDRRDWKGRPITGYRGWVFQDDKGTVFPELGVGLTPDSSATIADFAIDMLRQPIAKPFFLMTCFTAPHDPLLMPPGYEGKYDPAKLPLPANYLPRHPFDHGNFNGRDEQLWTWPRTENDVREELAYYYAVIEHMDAQIGRMIAVLSETGRLDDTVIVFTSDHGLAIGSHGLRGKQNMYDHTLGVPLILAGPGVPKGERRNAQVYLRDLYATTCELASIRAPDGLDSRSFATAIADPNQTGRAHVFGYFRQVQRAVRSSEYKLISYPHLDRVQLFDLRRDPLEQRDLSSDPAHSERRQQLMERLRAWQQEIDDPA